MDNVYQQVKMFYSQYPEAESILPREVIEGYFRGCAWQGKSDAQLKQIWDEITSILLYVENMGVISLSSLISYDYNSILSTRAEVHILSEENVNAFFTDMLAFYQYLFDKGYIEEYGNLYTAKGSFYLKGIFATPPIKPVDEYYSLLHHLEDVSMDEMDKLNDLLDSLLHKIGEYYRSAPFMKDLMRAVSLYKGPFDSEDDPDTAEDFWYGFWDYFFFDYHLIKTDLIPLEYFYRYEFESLKPSEIYVLQDLMKSKFTIFYIDSVGEEFIKGVNLFTGESFELPCPDYRFGDYKKMLLMGHIHSESMMLLNYITSFTVGMRLRKRIKDEILRQYELYQVQDENASLEEFFVRHAAVVRHIIMLLSSAAQLKVVHAKRQLPTHASSASTSMDSRWGQDKKTFSRIADKIGCSAFSIQLLLKMYDDFAALTRPDAFDSMACMAAMLLLFARMNGLGYLQFEDIRRELPIVYQKVSLMMSIVSDTLDCKEFNPRYLNEEGFVKALFLF